MKGNMRQLLIVSAALLAGAGCISVKTESEIKPIHITMDVNLKVDKELDKAFENENMSQPKGDFKEIRALLDRKVAGVTNRGLLEARAGATDDDKILIAESNAKKLKRMRDIAKESGVTLEDVQKRSAKRFQEKIPAKSGVWVQSEAGVWSQK